MPKARSTRSNGSKKSASGKKKKSVVSEPNPSLAVKAEELSDAEQKQLLQVEIPELTFPTNNWDEEHFVWNQGCFTDIELHASAPLSDRPSLDTAYTTPGLTMNASSPASSEILPATPTNEFLSDTRENVGLWPSAEEVAFAEAYSDYLYIPRQDDTSYCPQPQRPEERVDILAVLEDSELDNCCAYTPQNAPFPALPPLIDPAVGTMGVLIRGSNVTDPAATILQHLKA